MQESKTEPGVWKIMERYVDDSVEIGKIDMKAMKEDDGKPTGNRELFLRECKSEAGLWKIIDRYVDENKEVVRGWMVTYVDDLLVASRGKYGRRVLEEVRKQWKCSDTEILNHGEEMNFIGLQICRLRGGGLLVAKKTP